MAQSLPSRCFARRISSCRQAPVVNRGRRRLESVRIFIAEYGGRCCVIWSSHLKSSCRLRCRHLIKACLEIRPQPGVDTFLHHKRVWTTDSAGLQRFLQSGCEIDQPSHSEKIRSCCFDVLWSEYPEYHQRVSTAP